MTIRPYNINKDKEAAHRIWLECGWLEKEKESIFDDLMIDQCSLIAEIGGEAECISISAEGSIWYQAEELPASIITGVTTSRIARKQGLAKRVTADLVAHNTENGATVSLLGIFDQGFYDHLGFGTGSYEHWVSFDPSQLKINVKPRIPKRLTADDFKVMHLSRLNRLKHHGICNLYPNSATSTEMKWADNGFGLGYFDGPDGELTHHLVINATEVEPGPYNIWWMSYQNYDQFLELMGLVKNLGDQVNLVSVREPQGIQFQDLLNKPFHFRNITQKSKYEQRARATAYWQIRICDLKTCLEKTHLPDPILKFNLELSDPIEKYVSKTYRWRGISGKYTITLGTQSSVKSGFESDLPTLKTTVNAFSRMWLGVVPATGLSVTENLQAPPELLQQLNEKFRLPRPSPDWDF